MLRGSVIQNQMFRLRNSYQVLFAGERCLFHDISPRVLSRALSVNRYLLSFLQPSLGLSRLRLVGWTLKALFMFKIVG